MTPWSEKGCHVVVEAAKAAATSAENVGSTWQCPPDFYYFGATMDIYYFGRLILIWPTSTTLVDLPPLLLLLLWYIL